MTGSRDPERTLEEMTLRKGDKVIYTGSKPFSIVSPTGRHTYCRGPAIFTYTGHGDLMVGNDRVARYDDGRFDNLLRIQDLTTIEKEIYNID